MPHTRDRGRRAGAAVVVLITAALGGCGAPDVEARARAEAEEGLRLNVDTAVSCVQTRLDAVLSASGDEELAEELSTCASTEVLNLDDDQILRADLVLSASGTAALSAVAEGDGLALAFVTESSARVEAGVASARVTLATCWSATAGRGSSVLGGIEGVACPASVLSWAGPAEEQRLEDVGVPGSGGT